MNILFVGTPATPYGNRACDVKLAAFANIVAKEHNVTILNRYSPIKDRKDICLNKRVCIKEIINKHNSLSLFFFLLSVLIEPFVIFDLNRKKKIDIIQIYSGHYLDFVFYKSIAFLIGAKVIYQYDEYALEKERRSGYYKWNSRRVDLKGPKLWDGVVCISDFLQEHAQKVNPNIVSMKLTPICDFSSFEQIHPENNRGKYLLFCGSIGYYEVVDIIINSYRKSAISNSHDLILVLSGNEEKVESFKQKNTDITVLSGLPYDTLLSLYKGAVGLLIPLRNTIEDIARFPNKICEYLAAKGLVITTKYGEMPNYFKDGYNALVAEDFTVESITSKLDWLDDNLDKVDNLKKTAYKELYTTFDQDSNFEAVNDFLSKL